jgi:ABC-2 type transport system permease protein
MEFTGFYTLLKREVARFFVVIHQTLTPAIVSAVLYIIIFGYSIGHQIAKVGGFDYIQFIVPGLIMMDLIISGYSSTSFSLFMSRRFGSIKDVLVSPLSYLEMSLAITLAGVIRSMLVSLGILIVAIFLTKIHGIFSIFWTLYFSVGVSLIFSSLGVIIGLRSDEFEDLNVLITFFLTPLTFLGGVFYSIKTLPHLFQQASLYNPILYMVDGLRYGILGVHDTNIYFGAALVFVLAAGLFTLTVYLFKIGWKLRN